MCSYEKRKEKRSITFDSDDTNEAEQEKENIFSKFENPCLKHSITALSGVILDQPMNEKRINIQDNLTLKKKMNSCENSENIVLPFEELNAKHSNKFEIDASCPKSGFGSSSKRSYETSDDEDIDFQKCKKWIKLNHLKDTDKKEETPFLCEICKSNLEDLNFEERSIHMNRCIDQQSESGLPAVTESSSSNAVFILECPLCFKNFSTPELRSTHVKKCGKSRGLTVQSVVKALQLQEKHALERRMLGLPLKPMKQAKQQKKPVMKRLIEPKNEQQSDIQLAKALSLSLDEENKKQHRPCEEDIIPLTAVLKAPDDSQNPGRKANKCNRIVKETPLLLLRTEEERRKILEEKVDAIVNPLNMIESNITEEGNTESSSKSLSNQMQVPLLWNLSSKSEEKTMYYVEQLLDWITPSNTETGCKLFNLSQIPGYHIITQIAHDYSFSNSNTDAVLPEHDQTLDSNNSVIDCFQSLVASSYMSDVEIHTASGIVIPAHKLFLCARCPSLKKLLDTTSHKKYVLDWKDISFDGALQFLNFIYTGNAEWKDDLIPELTSLANKYSVHDLLRQINSNCGSLKTVAEVGVHPSSRIANVDVEINASDMHSAKEQYRSHPVENNNPPVATNLNIRNENNFHCLEKVFREDRNLCDCEVVEIDKFSQVSNINLEIVNNFINSSLQLESPAKSELNRCEASQNDISETGDIINRVSEFRNIKEMSENTATCSTNFSPNHCCSKKLSEINNILLKSEKEQSVMRFNSASGLDNLSSDCDEDIAIVGEFSQKSSSQISNVDICERNIMHDSCSALCAKSNSQNVNKTLTQDTFPTAIEEHSTYVSYYQNNIQNVTVQSNILVNDLCKNMHECTRALPPNLEIPIIKDTHKSFDEFRDLQQQFHDNKNGSIITASSAVDCLFTLQANVSNFPVDKSVCRSPNKFTSSSKSKGDISSPEILISDSDEELPAVLLSDSDEDIPGLLNSAKIIENESMSDADQVIVNRSVSKYSPYRDSSTYNFSPIPDSSNVIELRNDLSPDILTCSSGEDGSSDEVKETVPFTETAEKASCKSDNTDQLFIRSQVCFGIDNDEQNGKQQIRLDVGSNELVERNKANDKFSKEKENSVLLNNVKLNETNWIYFDSNETCEKDQIFVDSEDHELNEGNSTCRSSGKKKEKELPNDLDLSSDDLFLPLSERIRALTKEDSFQDFQAANKQNKVSETDIHISNLKSRKSSAVRKLSAKTTQQKKYKEISHCEKKENYSTPVVQDKCFPQFKLSDSPITPLPDYKNMVTPDIKQALKNIGVRALPRKKAVALLSRVYDETHPWADENCVGVVEKSLHDLPAVHQTVAIKQGKQNHEKHQKRKHRLMMKMISEKPSRSLSSSSSQEDVLNNPSNSRLSDELHVCSSQLNDDNQPTSNEDMKLLKEYILSNEELYLKILNYVPINLNDLHELLKENGIKINNKKLMDYLDEQCIVFTYPRTEEYRKKQQIRSQRFRKRKIAKLSQQEQKN